ncbi:MAG: response regulator [Elainellaceae cyanobacterium]
MVSLSSKSSIPILVAEDDERDRHLIDAALAKSELKNPVHFVKDGNELLHYLCQDHPYDDRQKFPKPGLILLDLNMPDMDGREILKVLRGNPTFRHIPIIMFTVSCSRSDVQDSYMLGVNSFIIKPIGLAQLVNTLNRIGRYWFKVVSLPPRR